MTSLGRKWNLVKIGKFSGKTITTIRKEKGLTTIKFKQIVVNFKQNIKSGFYYEGNKGVTQGS